MKKIVDGGLGIWIWHQRMVGAAETTKLCHYYLLEWRLEYSVKHKLFQEFEQQQKQPDIL